ncbi:cytochrome c biogenesis ATP-binding export protein CcmA [Sphingobium jiangsuense]|uniref:Heme exporter protein A n=1 Tax=Sphingobium jiangsuense TaxID=870476 RepID=A0A7W6BG19_9SPHN|nr:heme ABC exporter ATP-binding protein CcmA [Sphingobium jiangsuense]MBB3926238.1 heme exporter protein A [Sphingobium jiangsuense]GLS99953.1 cytochrome c biogenesis ATP-binding export protein CcmA [Sphingobium jiangsuense]
MSDPAAVPPLLDARNIACQRGGRMIFAGVTLTIGAGQSLLVRGPNGAGKSSLLRVLGGLIPCLHGTIDRHAPIALADEHLALDPDNRLEQALAFWARMDGVDRERLDFALHHFRLRELADIPVRMLSTGQRKRAILARTMASGARLWLLDEPGNGLDAASLRGLGDAMAAHLAAGGGIIAASHFDLSHQFGTVVELDRR